MKCRTRVRPPFAQCKESRARVLQPNANFLTIFNLSRDESWSFDADSASDESLIGSVTHALLYAHYQSNGLSSAYLNALKEGSVAVFCKRFPLPKATYGKLSVELGGWGCMVGPSIALQMRELQSLSWS